MEKLGKYVNIQTGKLNANASSDTGQYPFFTCAIEPLKIDNYAYDCDCVLVAGNGDLNVKYYNGKFNAYQRTYIIESKDKNILDTKFLKLFLDKSLEKLRANTKGGIIKYIRLNDLTDLKINLPDLLTQKRIAKILSHTETLIAKRKESIQMLDEFVKATFLEMFGDPAYNHKNLKKTTIKNLVNEVKYGTSKSAKGGKYPYLRMNNINYNGYWDFSDLKYIDIDDSEKEKYLLKKGDVVFNRTNSKELVGKTAIYNQDTEMIIAGYLIRVRVKDEVNPYYLWGHLNSHFTKKRLFNLCRNIVGMANINAQELQKIPILFPPLPLQNQFAEIVKKTEVLKKQFELSLQELQNLYGSLSQRAFKGELDLSKVEISEEIEKEFF